jgi:hypothetical protein
MTVVWDRKVMVEVIRSGGFWVYPEGEANRSCWWTLLRGREGRESRITVPCVAWAAEKMAVPITEMEQSGDRLGSEVKNSSALFCTAMFPEALFIIAKIRTEPRCL